ncbi:hypothetical protein [Dictyobacter alpinus]|nr:hypothetical protein [Dictyobacter alpinus]
MTRKDSEKDSERPHYYSQFWLDVAAGRRVIGAPRPEDGEGAEAEIPEAAPQRRGRFSDSSDGQGEKIVHPVAEPVRTPQDFIEPDTEDYELPANDHEDLSYQNELVEDADVPDVDLAPEEEEEDVFEEDVEEDEEEEDDDMNWGRGRKKPKPTRATKPVAKKPGKRDTRRPY